jgi:translation elongation factor aEF-1 beta
MRARVLVRLRVLPKDVGTNLDELELEIRRRVRPDRLSRQPIAFGLTALVVTKLIPDARGELEMLESELRGIRGVGQIDVLEVSRAPEIG